ncbi:MAG: hypothetical protein KAS93_00745 [Gammaproteobacteria bacterium]|nr:hypothetical protein [Gammaproteobacteria bacterium]
MLVGQFFNRVAESVSSSGISYLRDASGQMDDSLLPTGDGWLTIGSAIIGGTAVITILSLMGCGICCAGCCGGWIGKKLWSTSDTSANQLDFINDGDETGERAFLLGGESSDDENPQP